MDRAVAAERAAVEGRGGAFRRELLELVVALERRVTRDGDERSVLRDRDRAALHRSGVGADGNVHGHVERNALAGNVLDALNVGVAGAHDLSLGEHLAKAVQVRGNACELGLQGSIFTFELAGQTGAVLCSLLELRKEAGIYINHLECASRKSTAPGVRAIGERKGRKERRAP